MSIILQQVDIVSRMVGLGGGEEVSNQSRISWITTCRCVFGDNQTPQTNNEFCSWSRLGQGGFVKIESVIRSNVKEYMRISCVLRV